ncbi:MAG TPA: carboxypeptidase-like regulatory domain-containing protein, partial [Pyrinomonadaceae bacterium]
MNAIRSMKKLTTKTLGRRVLSLILAVFSVGLYLTPAEAAGKGNLATITGAVLDNNGNPVSGALISLLRDGASKIIKQTRSDASGRFTARISPGRYGIRAFATGFNEVVFSAVEVRASQELVYRFNLEPIGSGKTLPERRRDRDDVKWILRSAQTRRSIFQAQEGDDAEIQAILGNEPTATPATTEAATDDPSTATETTQVATEASNHESGRRIQGVVETYFTSSEHSAAYPGLNFAVSTSPTDRVELIFAGQTTAGSNGPERFEATTLMRAGDRHRVGMSFGAVSFGEPVWFHANENQFAGSGPEMGQVSVRAIDEWIVRDGIVVVLGLDYSRFIGGGSDDSFTPRIGIQYDANARTRVRVAYAPGGDEGNIQSLAAFENAQIAFRDPNKRPIAFVDGRAVMDRSHRLEFGIERVIDGKSNLEGTAFFDTTSGRGVGLLSTPMTAFSGAPGEAFISVANQQGAARGMRLVYTRRLSRMWTASGGYSFGRGQRLASGDISDPADIFESGFFQSAALQLGA